MPQSQVPMVAECVLERWWYEPLTGEMATCDLRSQPTTATLAQPIEDEGESWCESGACPSQELVPPDGGWGWVIVLANCIISGVMLSLTCAFGVVYVHLVSSGYTNAQVVAIPAVFIGFTNLLGPLSTGLSQFYPFRRLSLIGISLAATGIFLCSLYTNLWWFYFCYGALAGTGNALAFHQSFLISQQYFRKKRATANGLSMVGGSLGFMLQPPLLAYLVDNYSSKGAFMLWSGIILHGLIGASLLHPVSWHLKPSKQTFQQYEEEREESQKDSLANDTSSIQSQQDGIISENCDQHQNYELAEYKKSLNYESDDCDQDNLTRHGKERNVLLLSEVIKKENSATQSERSHDSEIDDEDNNISPSYLQQKPKTLINRRLTNLQDHGSSDKIHRLSVALQDFGSAMSLEIHKQKADVESSGDSITSVNSSEIPYIICGLKIPRITSIVKLSVLKHPVFLLMTFSSVCNRVVYSAYVTYVPSVGYEVGVGSWSPYLLTTIAIFELLAKCIMSVISDQGWLQRRYIYIIASFSAGMANFALTSAWNFPTLVCCCALYGFGVGTCMSVGPVLLVEYIGMELLRCSFGLLLFMCGAFGLIFLPFTGWLTDTVGNYTSAYYVMGGLCMMPPVLWLLLPCFYKHKAHDNN